MDEPKASEQIMSDEQVADMVVGAIPKVISFIIILAVGFLLLLPLELYFETWLQQYIPSKMAVTAILLLIAFGPLTYFEEKLEDGVSSIFARVMRKQLENGKKTALEKIKTYDLQNKK